MSTYIRYANINDSHILGTIHSQSLKSAFKGIIPDEFIEGNFTYERRKAGFERELTLGNPKTVIMFKDENRLVYLPLVPVDMGPLKIPVLKYGEYI